MKKEIAVQFYLIIFNLFFSFFKLFPLKRKSVFVVYLGHNALFTIEELEKISNEKIVICYSKSTQVQFKKVNNRVIIHTSIFSWISWIRMVYHLATADNIVVDTYYAFLSKSKFKKGVLCIQLWHAAGAMKKFALLDKSLEKRPEMSKKRFTKAYNRFTHVVAGSKEMGDIFKQCFGINGDKILYTGVPRTDLFFSEEKKEKAINRLNKVRPDIASCEKKKILYAPTFRDDQMTVNKCALDIEEMYEDFKDDYVILLKLHPAVKNKISIENDDFVIDVSDYSVINDLLLVSDILITDYSSIPFEYAFLNRPIIFFAYDLEDYSKNRGTWRDYKSTSPGPIAHTTIEVNEIIKNNEYDLSLIKGFKELWSNYSNGTSSKDLCTFIEKNRINKKKTIE